MSKLKSTVVQQDSVWFLQEGTQVVFSCCVYSMGISVIFWTYVAINELGEN